MDEILRNLPTGARVLDLGCRDGSFPRSAYPRLRVTALDLEPGAAQVQGDAGRLPFRDAAFDAVIANHSLEHMADLEQVLAEMGRVVRPGGGIYISVPDASTFSDRLYRWIFHGGGHFNPFRNAGELALRIEAATGLCHLATRTLHTSFLFLGRRHFKPRPPRRMWLFANGDARAVLALGYACRLADQVFGTRLSVYGWGLWFGAAGEPVDTLAWTNVCVECGHATPAALLQPDQHAFLPVYRCGSCGARNLFTNDGEEGT
jgi:SAM-dependent methyltransferase